MPRLAHTTIGVSTLGLAAAVATASQPLAGQDPGVCPPCEQAALLVDRFGLEESANPVRERTGWTPPRKVVTVFGPEFAALLSPMVPDAEVIGVNGPAQVPAVIDGADVYIGTCTPDIIAAGRDLKYIHIPRAGADTCAAIPEVAERGILVTNMQRILGPQIADHAMALILMLSRNTAAYARQQAQGAFDWSGRTAEPLSQLEGRTMLIVGLGGIGTEVARRADAFGMRVTATRNSSREGPDFVDYVGLAPEAMDLAAEADVVVNATPLTPDTEGMFDAAFFQAMPSTAWFINVGRGESVVTADLVAALESGAIAGAGLDVYDPEPLPPGHPLWSMPNVVLTPHVAGLSDLRQVHFGGFAAENFRRYAAGDPVLNVVDVRRGY